jgi:predicted metalloendopeptidase
MSKAIPLDPSNIDSAADPGSDFFRFANGRWLDSNPVPPEFGSWGSFSEVHVRNEELLHGLLDAAADETGTDAVARMAGDYFASGLDVAQIEGAGVEPIRSWLEKIATIETSTDFGALVPGLHRLGAHVLFGWYVAPDFEDSSRYLLYAGQGGLGLPERDYYLRDDERSVGLRDLYLGHVTAQLVNLGASREDAAADAAEILRFETSLAEPAYTAAQLRDVDLTTNKTRRDDVDSLMPSFGFGRYLDAIGAEAADHVNLDNPGFFEAVDRLVAEAPIDVLRAYARWHLVRAVASALPSSFEDESFEFYGKALGGQQEQRERWKRVLAAASGEVGDLVSQIYVGAAFSAEAKARCEEMVAGLVIAMGDSIRALTWMSEDTKRQALAKLDGFGYKIGYPDKWKDYTGLEIDRGPWALNRLRARDHEFNREISKLDGPVDETEWSMPAHVVNAYYHPTRNEIVFPAGILQPPFFYPDADDAVNYGGIGSVIGHEITHGFDDQGSRFDADGHLRNWWTEDDRAEFERRAEVVVAQFDSFTVADDLNVNGRLTLGENIADLGGVSIAFHALQRVLDGGRREEVDGYSPEQRFFLSYGTIWRRNYTDEFIRLLVNTDPHSPSMFRTNGALANVPEFAAAFSLGEDSPMMRPPTERAEIW